MWHYIGDDMMFRDKDEVLGYLCTSNSGQKWFGEPAEWVDDDLVIEYLCRTNEFNTCAHLLNSNVVNTYYSMKKDDRDFDFEKIPHKFRTIVMYHSMRDKKGLLKETKIIIDLLFNGLSIKDICRKYGELPTNVNTLLECFEENAIAVEIEYNLRLAEADFFESIDSDIEILLEAIKGLDLSWDVLSDEDKIRFANETCKLSNSIADVYEYIVGNNLNEYSDIVTFCKKFLGFKFEHDVSWLKEFDMKNYFGMKRGRPSITIIKKNSNGEAVNITPDVVDEILEVLNKNNIPTFKIIVDKAIASYVDNEFDAFINSMSKSKTKDLGCLGGF